MDFQLLLLELIIFILQLLILGGAGYKKDYSYTSACGVSSNFPKSDNTNPTIG